MRSTPLAALVIAGFALSNFAWGQQSSPPPSAQPTPPQTVPPATAPAAPKAAPKTAAPKSISPKIVSPKAASPKSAAPKSAAPKTTTSKTAAPKTATPKAATSKAVAPKIVPPPPVAPDRQQTILERVNAYLSGLRFLSGRFVQIGPDRTRTEGDFYVQKPGRLRFDYDAPSRTELIADGKMVAVRDRRLNSQDLYPLSQTPLRFLLADKIDLSQDTKVVSVSADAAFATVVIEERQTFAGTHKLMLMFGAQDYVLRQWVVTDPQGYQTTVSVHDLDTTKRPDPALFRINYERMLQ